MNKSILPSTAQHIAGSLLSNNNDDRYKQCKSGRNERLDGRECENARGKMAEPEQHNGEDAEADPFGKKE